MSAFRGLYNVVVVGREIRPCTERLLKQGICISEVRFSEVPLYYLFSTCMFKDGLQKLPNNVTEMVDDVMKFFNDSRVHKEKLASIMKWQPNSMNTTSCSSLPQG